MTAKKLRRSVAVDAPDFIEEKDERIIELAFSSEAPYTRYYTNQDGEQVELKEILVHDESAVDLSVLNETNASLLFNHNLDLHIGKIVPGSARIDEDRIGRCLVQFSKVGQLANECFEKVKESTLSQVSVGYNVLDGKADFSKGIYYVTRWQPYEVSIVTCAADPFNAGVGRSLNTDNEMIVLEGEQVEDEIKEEIKPEDEEIRSEEKEEQENEESDSDSGNNPDSSEHLEEPQEVTPDEEEKRSEDEPEEEIKPEETEELNKDTDENDETVEESETVEEEKIEDEEKPFERSREDTAEIRAIGKHLNIPEATIEAAIKDSAVTIENFKEKARALNTTESKTFVKGKITMTDTIKNLESRVSIAKTLRGIAGIAKFDGAEKEYHEEMLRQNAARGKAPQGETSVYIPVNALRTKGQYKVDQAPLVGEEIRHDSFVDLLMESSALGKMGFRVLSGLTGPISIPKLTERSVENFKFLNEAEDMSDDNKFTFGSVKLDQATLAGAVPVTRSALIQSGSALSGFIADQIVACSRQRIEKAILQGGVTNAPKSIIQILEEAGKKTEHDMTYADFVRNTAALVDAGVDATRLKHIMTASQNAVFETTLREAGLPGYISENGRINNIPVVCSGLAAKDKIISGDMSGVVIGEWGNGAVELNLDQHTLAASGGLVVRLFADVSWTVADMQSLTVLTKKAGE
ncbi:phage major capsid protein [Escherichia coli]|nr:phage major capsid protein [Escherichia coli]